jgi:hypothetical protein
MGSKETPIGGEGGGSIRPSSSDANQPDSEAADRVERATRIIVGLAAAFGLAAIGLLAWIHLSDRYAIQSTSGVLMALADYARRGVLFPPLFDGAYFGGTRYMPVGTLLHAGLAAFTGEYLMSGKILSGISAALLFVLIYRLVRHFGADRFLGLGLAATVIVGQVGLLATLSVRPEALPVSLTICALALATRPRHAATTGAALLCVAALLTKASAVTAPIAILIWLAATDRRSALRFSLTFFVAGAASFALFQLASGGRMLPSLVELGGAGITPGNVATAGLRVLEYAAQYAPASLLLAPLAVVAIERSVARHGLSVYQTALMVSIVGLAFVLTDQGADYNHLLEVIALVAIVVAEGLGRAGDAVDGERMYRAIVVLALAIGLLLSVGAGPGFDLALAIRHMVTDRTAMYDAHPVAPSGADRPVLSDDPYVPLSLGQRPVVLDSFMLLRIAQRHPDWTGQLVDRIRQGEFSRIVLRRAIGTPDANAAYTTQELGSTVYQAIESAYRLEAVVPDPGYSHLLPSRDFFVYVYAGGAP